MQKVQTAYCFGIRFSRNFAGPYFDLLPTVRDKEDLTLWADIGVIFLLFGLGLEFSFKNVSTSVKRQ